MTDSSQWSVVSYQKGRGTIEDRGKRIDDRGQKTDGRGQWSGVRGQLSVRLFFKNPGEMRGAVAEVLSILEKNSCL